MKKIKVNMQDAIAGSYRNFHTKGLNYICLSRSEELTAKLYILDGDAAAAPEVINPHDHRYAFTTEVLMGSMIDHRWIPCDAQSEGAEAYNVFDYMTPLNGGSGFTERGVEYLTRGKSKSMGVGGYRVTAPGKIHTIQMKSDQTVLLLKQYEDLFDMDTPTSTWSRDTPSISDSGLYERFTEGQIFDAIAAIGYEVELA